jgi:ribosomal protein S18 acetylase RimI-like enzyme
VAGSLRNFRDDDRDAALTLSRHALARLEEQVGMPLWSTRADVDHELASWPRPPEETLRVVETDGEVAALGGVDLEWEARVVGPLVAPRFRGQKMGSTLLAASIDLGRAAGAGWVRAAVGAHNVRGRLILERTGFRRREGLDAVYRLFPAEHKPAGPAPPGVAVRIGAAGDLQRIFVLYRQAFPAGRRSEDVWRRWLESGEVVVAEREGDVAAFVHVEPGARWIIHIGVAEEARGLGVGGYLFSTAVADFWAHHPERELRLSVLTNNTTAIRLYRRLGFAPWLLLERFELEL